MIPRVEEGYRLRERHHRRSLATEPWLGRTDIRWGGAAPGRDQSQRLETRVARIYRSERDVDLSERECTGQVRPESSLKVSMAGGPGNSPRVLMALLILRGERSCINNSSFFRSLYHSLCTGVVVVEEPKADWALGTFFTGREDTHLCRLTIEYQGEMMGTESSVSISLWTIHLLSRFQRRGTERFEERHLAKYP
jgi:hypothetical protein